MVESLASPRHRAFEQPAAVPLAEARLTDKARLSVLLQGAAVLTHLERAGWRLGSPEIDPRGESPRSSDGWEGAGLTSGGTLCLLPPAPGRGALQAQEQLRCLVARLFGGTEVAGRGQARRALRSLLGEWWQGLLPLAPERAVEQMLEAAPFLWEAACSEARRALVAELPGREVGEWRLSVAAPGAAARRLAARGRGLGRGQARSALEDLLAGGEARAAWYGPEDARGNGRPRAAPRTADSLRQGQSLAEGGKFEQALSALGGSRSVEARLLRARCQLALGRLGAAWSSIRRLQAAHERRAGDGARLLTAEQALELAEMAVRTQANRGRGEELGDWVSRSWTEARRAARGPDGPYLEARAQLLAAVAAGDQGREEERRRQLLACRERALEDSRLAWPWLRAAAQSALDRGEARAALAHLVQALREHRRRPEGERMSRLEAAELWNEIGLCRALLADLAGSEKAFAHSVRLFSRCEGPRKTTLALFNLAEIRIRRGRSAGTREILEQVTAENRAAGNLRAQVQDAELWARYELLLGRPHAARVHCTEARKLLVRRGLRWRWDSLAVLAARAHGWLDDPSAAAAELESGGRRALGEVEPEERPALLALAGDREGALAAAAGTPLADLWSALLCGDEAPADCWQALDQLGAYRAARTLFDAERVAPGLVPVPRLRWAAVVLRRAGAATLAEWLEGRDAGAWKAVSSYLLASRAAGESEMLEQWKGRVRALFAGAGHENIRLIWKRGDEQDIELCPGTGSAAGEVLSRRLGDGVLALRASTLDPVLEACFDLVTAGPPLAPNFLSAGADRSPLQSPQVDLHSDLNSRFRMVGTSEALHSALRRIDQLSPARMPVLLVGESGTGKELAARRVHRRGPSPKAPFVALNCAATSESLLLSDLFGHARGSFTGAERDRAGIFETAQDGTVFLDEIGDLPAAAQGMLLRVLQEGEVRRVGESLPRKVRARVVTATHRDLASQVQRKEFRQDLYYRLKVAAIVLPPLRERKEDILPLAEYFLSGAPEAFGGRLSTAAERALLTYRWPGNIRELRNILQVAAALAKADGGRIDARHLELPEAEPVGERNASFYHQQINHLRRKLLGEALAGSDGNRAEAARRLGLSRQALSYLTRELKIR